MRKIFLSIVCLALTGGTASAQQLQLTSGDWRVFTAGDGAGRQCYIASVPVKKTGNYSRRDEPFVMITNRGRETEEVSVSSGYTYKEGGQVSLVIDARRYELFTRADRAWAYDAEQDANLVSAMKKGSRMEVKGFSQKGTFSADSYSLSGFTNAFDKMKTLCQ